MDYCDEPTTATTATLSTERMDYRDEELQRTDGLFVACLPLLLLLVTAVGRRVARQLPHDCRRHVEEENRPQCAFAIQREAACHCGRPATACCGPN